MILQRGIKINASKKQTKLPWSQKQN